MQFLSTRFCLGSSSAIWRLVALGKPVLDRVGLIIEIFHAHAETKEAKLQSELAALMYKRSRLVRVRGPSGRLTFGASGEAEVVSARGRGSGGRGFISGAGETELQLQRRRIHERRNHLRSQIEEVRRTRSLQRHARRRHGGSQGQSLATVAIVGYTNAGKSTLVSALSETDLYCDDRLFATVDPRLRSVVLPSGRKALLSDTVGFISDLPVQLVEAFHATLEEVVEADLLVHVLDSSAPNLDEQRSTVLQVLQQIGVSQEKIENMIEVWNKIDLLDKNIGDDETLNQDEYLSEVEEEENLDEDECQLEGEGEENLEEDECLTGGEARESEGEGDGSFSGDKLTQGKIMSELSSEEDMESIEDQHPYSHKQQEMTGMTGPCEVKSAEHLETSAVTGVGLQELLTLIDEKLSTQSSIVTRSLGPLDRKWRPTYTADTAKEAGE
ncbi:uncharacterized protein M6B38_142330 [Iris pallida]|uniref:Hflx-type G domain-containing protein n=1 Tax=Iris pallida TaxID=29817 RepID=A0AAX6FB23_IRIPA|nr:uncharacterized protein M6B38_142330 [Iris pallida]